MPESKNLQKSSSDPDWLNELDDESVSSEGSSDSAPSEDQSDGDWIDELEEPEEVQSKTQTKPDTDWIDELDDAPEAVDTSGSDEGSLDTALDAPGEDSTKGWLGSALNFAGRGVGKGAANVVEGTSAGVRGAKLQRMNRIEETLKSGYDPDEYNDFLAKSTGEMPSEDELRRELRMLQEEEKSNPGFERPGEFTQFMADEFRNQIPKTFPVNPEYKGGMTQTLSEGVGQIGENKRGFRLRRDPGRAADRSRAPSRRRGLRGPPRARGGRSGCPPPPPGGERPSRARRRGWPRRPPGSGPGSAP